MFHLLLACLFSRSDSDLGQTSVIGLKITITCTLPVQLPIRQIPPFKREEVILGTSTEPGLVWMVFAHLHEAGLKLKPAKCALFRQILAMWNISPNGLTPTSTRELQQFLGFTSYNRRFVQDFVNIAMLLHHLKEDGVTFCRQRSVRVHLQIFCHVLMTTPVLSYPDFNQPFILDTDASGIGFGVIR